MSHDFHLHSHCSDGEFAPARVADIVADAGIRAFALTDHDTVGGYREARDRALARGVHCVAGLEMTSYAGGQVVHVLGLGIDPDDAGLARANATAMAVWSENQRRWAEALAREGFDVSPERDIGDRPVRLPVMIERLCLRGVAGGDPAACYRRFKEFFAALPPAAYDALPSPAAAAATIREAGGVSLLAHPARVQGDGLVERLIDDVDGIEALYAPYDLAAREALRALAVSRQKLYSCGSDYHGFFNGPYANPRFEAQPELLARLGVPSAI